MRHMIAPIGRIRFELVRRKGNIFVNCHRLYRSWRVSRKKNSLIPLCATAHLTTITPVTSSSLAYTYPKRDYLSLEKESVAPTPTFWCTLGNTSTYYVIYTVPRLRSFLNRLKHRYSTFMTGSYRFLPSDRMLKHSKHDKETQPTR